ncbi:MAG: YabP/YqfC family sporulation protein [Clostridia bacterium]|nr:YabP/YqfC family sporulation protein [Clostridia bacterium]
MNTVEQNGKSTITLKNREALTLDGIEDVVSFDENAIYLITSAGKLIIEGSGLHISSLDVSSGNMTVEGYVTAMIYNDRDKTKKNGLFSRK